MISFESFFVIYNASGQKGKGSGGRNFCSPAFRADVRRAETGAKLFERFSLEKRLELV